MDYDFSLFTSADMKQYSGLISGFISSAFDFGFPIFTALAGVSLFVLVVVMIYKIIKG